MESRGRPYKWLEIYTLECTHEKLELIHKLPNIKLINEYLKEDYSRKKVRNYFFEVHNPKTFEFMQKIDDFRNCEEIHLAVPYEIKDNLGDSLVCMLREPFYDLPGFIPRAIFSNKMLENALLYEVFDETPKTGEILITHGKYIVDAATEEDIKKYDYLYEKGKKKKRK